MDFVTAANVILYNKISLFSLIYSFILPYFDLFLTFLCMLYFFLPLLCRMSEQKQSGPLTITHGAGITKRTKEGNIPDFVPLEEQGRQVMVVAGISLPSQKRLSDAQLVEELGPDALNINPGLSYVM